MDIKLLYLLIGILLILGCTYLIFKIVDWQENRKSKRFSSINAEFLADLFKLQNKWLKKGEASYAKSIGLVIEAEILEDSGPEPKTQYGKDILAASKLMEDGY